MIINEVTKNDFHDAFRRMGRSDQFSYDALNALFDYLDEQADSMHEPYELDVIALCCEYSEYEDFEALQDDYASIESMEDLEGETTVIHIDTNSFLIQPF